jgi:hypothetical protein
VRCLDVIPLKPADWQRALGQQEAAAAARGGSAKRDASTRGTKRQAESALDDGEAAEVPRWEKWRVVMLGFGTARQKTVLEHWTNPKRLGTIYCRYLTLRRGYLDLSIIQ